MAALTSDKRTDGSAGVLDLGPLDGPVLVFGGPYSNLQATEAMLAAATRHGIPAGRTICTGDVVAYGAEPQATVDAVRAAGIHVVMGNCEESLGTQAGDCGCGFAEGSACADASLRWYAHVDAEITRSARSWMAALPRQLRFRLSGRSFAVIHGGVDRINRFIFASTPQADKRAELDLAGTDAVIGGHCGLPFTQALGPRLWHNAGVVGMPANDGTARTSGRRHSRPARRLDRQVPPAVTPGDSRGLLSTRPLPTHGAMR